MRSSLAPAVMDRSFERYGDLETGGFIDEYRRRSFLTGRAIHFSLGNAVYHGVVTGISDEAHLLVRLDSGEERAFSAGEVQIPKGFCPAARRGHFPAGLPLCAVFSPGFRAVRAGFRIRG